MTLGAIELQSTLVISILGVVLDDCFLIWINMVTDGRISPSEIITCQLYNYLYYWFSHASVWILTVMTGERAASILLPFKAQIFSTIKMAKIVSAITLLFWGLVDFQWIFACKTVEKTNQNPDGCDYPMSQKYYDLYAIFDNLCYSLLPGILIFTFNITIVVKLLSVKHRSQQANQTSAVSTSAMSTTVMLLSVSVSFTILTTPITVYYIIYRDWYAVPELYQLMMFLLYVNHSSNAVMYTLISPTFRRGVKRFFCKASSNENSMNSTSETRHGNRVGPSEM